MARWRQPNQEDVPLTGMLAEFRTALREEIEAARRNESSSSVPLINGRRIGQIGGSYQYSFDVENLLNLPGDAPGDLYVQGHAPLEVVVVSTVGMRIVLSVPSDLGTIVPYARLQSNLAQLMRKLIERIEGLANAPNPVGQRVLGQGLVGGVAWPLSEARRVNEGKGSGDCLNQQQLDALASSLGRDTTFIWGPPGTGKTQTIGAIGEQLYRRGRSVLRVSHTNSAVDEAILRIADTISQEELAKGKVVRVGNSAEKRFENEKYREVLLATHKDRRSAELAQRRDACREKRDAAAIQVLQILRSINIAEWTEQAEMDIVNMCRELGEVRRAEAAVERARAEHQLLVSQTVRWLAANEDAKHAKIRLDAIRELDRRIVDANAVVVAGRAGLNSAQERLGGAERLLADTTSVGWLTRTWRGLPAPDKQQAEVVERSRCAAACLSEALQMSRV
jgi:hypothetical protein